MDKCLSTVRWLWFCLGLFQVFPWSRGMAFVTHTRKIRDLLEQAQLSTHGRQVQESSCRKRVSARRFLLSSFPLRFSSLASSLLSVPVQGRSAHRLSPPLTRASWTSKPSGLISQLFRAQPAGSLVLHFLLLLATRRPWNQARIHEM